jgi:hypothetical protein
MKQQPDNKKAEPTIAPGMEIDAPDRDATSDEIERGDSTEVTKLFLDRTPED